MKDNNLQVSIVGDKLKEENLMSKLKIKEYMKTKFQELDEEKQVLFKRLGICTIIWLVVMSITFIVIAARGLIDSIPWYSYGDFRYVGYTLGAITLGFYFLNYCINYLSNRKKMIKKKPPKFVYYLYFGMVMYISLLIFFTFSPRYQ